MRKAPVLSGALFFAYKFILSSRGGQIGRFNWFVWKEIDGVGG
jgi:hypothetical protein